MEKKRKEGNKMNEERKENEGKKKRSKVILTGSSRF